MFLSGKHRTLICPCVRVCVLYLLQQSVCACVNNQNKYKNREKRALPHTQILSCLGHCGDTVLFKQKPTWAYAQFASNNLMPIYRWGEYGKFIRGRGICNSISVARNAHTCIIWCVAFGLYKCTMTMCEENIFFHINNFFGFPKYLFYLEKVLQK